MGYLLDAATYWNKKLRTPATAVLNRFMDQHTHRRSLQEYVASRSWDPHQESIFRGMGLKAGASTR